MTKRQQAGSPPRVAISSSQRAMRVPRKAIAELVAFVAEAEGYPVADADIAVVDRGRIAELNRRYLRHAGATDVLSFDLSQGPARGLSVQIIVCGDVAAAEAAARNTIARRELLLYVVHGLLHVMGYEDQSVRGSAAMQARQEELLEQFERPGRGGPDGKKPRTRTRTRTIGCRPVPTPALTGTDSTTQRAQKTQRQRKSR